PNWRRNRRPPRRRNRTPSRPKNPRSSSPNWRRNRRPSRPRNRTPSRARSPSQALRNGRPTAPPAIPPMMPRPGGTKHIRARCGPAADGTHHAQHSAAKRQPDDGTAQNERPLGHVRELEDHCEALEDALAEIKAVLPFEIKSQQLITLQIVSERG